MKAIAHVLCPSCYERIGGEEKCCGHGCGDAKCVECGAVRDEDDEEWFCVGTKLVSSECDANA